MTKSEATAINMMLPPAQQDIQEVHLRLKMHSEGKLLLDDDNIQNAMVRLGRAVDVVMSVNKMALAELN